jgi:predicted O-methyltransferase YrrM
MATRLAPDGLPVGWFWQGDIDYYKWLASFQKPGCLWVEIGSCFGRSTCVVAPTLSKLRGARLVSVDIRQASFGNTLPVFLDNLQHYDVRDFVEYHTMSSLAALKLFEDNSIDVLYLDGAHDYETVKAEIIYYWPKVKQGGFIAGHDYYNKGRKQVKRAVDEMFMCPDGTCGQSVGTGCSWHVHKKQGRTFNTKATTTLQPE